MGALVVLSCLFGLGETPPTVAALSTKWASLEKWLNRSECDIEVYNTPNPAVPLSQHRITVLQRRIRYKVMDGNLAISNQLIRIVDRKGGSVDVNDPEKLSVQNANSRFSLIRNEQQTSYAIAKHAFLGSDEDGRIAAHETGRWFCDPVTGMCLKHAMQNNTFLDWAIRRDNSNFVITYSLQHPEWNPETNNAAVETKVRLLLDESASCCLQQANIETSLTKSTTEFQYELANGFPIPKQIIRTVRDSTGVVLYTQLTVYKKFNHREIDPSEFTLTYFGLPEISPPLPKPSADYRWLWLIALSLGLMLLSFAVRAKWGTRSR